MDTIDPATITYDQLRDRYLTQNRSLIGWSRFMDQARQQAREAIELAHNNIDEATELLDFGIIDPLMKDAAIWRLNGGEL